MAIVKIAVALPLAAEPFSNGSDNGIGGGNGNENGSGSECGNIMARTLFADRL